MATNAGLYLSGGSTNTLSADSLGGQISLTEAPTNLFPSVTPRLTQDTIQHRCIYVKNISGASISNIFIYITDLTLDGGDVELALGGDVNETAFLLPNEESSPPSITFSSPTEDSPLSVDSLANGEYISIWIRRTTSSGQLQREASDGFTLCVVGGN